MRDSDGYGEMEIQQGKRAGDIQRQDTTNHLVNCASYGWLESEEAEKRMDAAREAKTLNQLAGLVRDLPDPGELRAIQHKTTSRVKKASLDSVEGRLVLHTWWACISLVSIFGPTWAAVNNHWSGLFVVLVCCTSIFAGIGSLVLDCLFAALWSKKSGRVI